ncbi:MAG: 4Fe-4S dicluster domain-containing protein [Oligoflexales bacterium]|nr:4Fe-4S dicluster domain-containing protein [Oligoflexales bacterium]
MQKKYIFDKSEFNRLVELLLQTFSKVFAPQIKDGAIVYEQLEAVDQLPRGVTDEQAAGSYKLIPSFTDMHFSYAVGPDSPKKFFFKAQQKLWAVEKKPDGRMPQLQVEHQTQENFALIGLRACDLKAIKNQDVVFSKDNQDPYYFENRSGAFLIGVNCTHPSANCFCTSFDYGPFHAEKGLDLELTELEDSDGIYYIAVAHSKSAQNLLDKFGFIAEKLPQKWKKKQAQAEKNARLSLNKSLDYQKIRKNLKKQLQSPAWDDLDQRCLSCGNCTLVCPTCFCSDVYDKTDLSGQVAEKWRVWDSCFNKDHSAIHGGVVHKTTAAKYRQWLTHKLVSWQDQFGESGCVGCGRCTTWCPVGIDLVTEAKRISESEL